MSGFLDYAEDMNLEIILMGLSMMFLPYTLSFVGITEVMPGSISVIQILLLFLYGVVTVLGGFLHGEALYLRSFMDLSAVVGLVIFATAIYPVIETSLWTKTSIIGLFFLAIPSLALTYFNRESRFENHREDDRDYMGRD